MSTTSVAQLSPGAVAGLDDRPRAAAATAPKMLAFALLAAIAYAAAAHGATSSAAQQRLQIGLALVAAFAAGAWLWTGTLRLAAPRLATAGTVLLGAFAIWSGITLLWSVAPDQTWIELNRTIAYVLVLCLAIALGASYARAVQVIATGFWVIALAISCYGLGQKLVPGLHAHGVFNLNQTGPVSRLQQPFGYWNALALFIAIGIPVALAITVDQSAARRKRVVGVASLELTLLAFGCTFSRGGTLALILGLAAGVALGGAWLRSLVWLATGALATAPPLVFALTNRSLTAANVSLADREVAGAVLAALLAASLIVLIVAARTLIEREHVLELGPAATRRAAWRLAAIAAALLAGVVIALSLSPRGFDGTISHAWTAFTRTHVVSNSRPNRLLAADAQNRWVWWKEAAGAIRDRPLGGWGAGSFPVVHLLYRHDTLSVREPHSVPLQWLVETGVIGAALAIGGVVLLLATAVRGTRTRPRGGERLLMAALTAGAVSYAVQALYDWSWDVPGVTVPVLVFVGVIAGSLAPREPKADLPLLGSGRTLRALVLVLVTLGLSSYALSALLPNLAASKARSALVTAASGSPQALARAHKAAALASTLDPLSGAGLKAQAAIATQRGQPRLARTYLLDAVTRNPSDAEAWSQLANVELVTGNVEDARTAATRALQLDPQGQAQLAAEVLQRIKVLQTPPADSATSFPTPITAQIQAAPHP
jgi:hypothetical protein